MKKILALIMALTMIFTLAITVSAVDVVINGNTTDGTTTGETMVAYKVLDATISGTAYSYTIAGTNPFYGVIRNGKYFETPELITGTNTYNVTPKADFDDNKAKDLAKELNMVSNKGAGVTATYDSAADTYTFSGLSLGYYLIVDSLGQALIVDTVTAGENGTLTLERKNEYPDLVKTVEGSETGTTADGGQILDFEITVTIPENPKGNIIVHDKMTGLVWDEMDTIEGLEVSLAPTDGCTVHFTMDQNFLDDNKGKEVTICYTAQFVDDHQATNEAWLVNNNFTSTHDTVTINTTDLHIFKYDAADRTNTLKDAQFILSKEVGGKTYYYKEASTAGNKTVVEWVLNRDDARVCWTGVDGYDYFYNLADGEYTLTEVVAPEGYNLLAEPITFTISNATATVPQTGIIKKYVQVDVPNSSGSELPETGGIGTTLFYVIGTLMMTGAAVLMITKKRMSV